MHWFHLHSDRMEERDDIMLNTFTPYPGICRTLLFISYHSYLFTRWPMWLVLVEKNHKSFTAARLCWPGGLYFANMAEKLLQTPGTKNQILMWYLSATLLTSVLYTSSQYFAPWWIVNRTSVICPVKYGFADFAFYFFYLAFSLHINSPEWDGIHLI